jgi:hypothetical protein
MTILGIVLMTIVPPAIIGLFTAIEEWPEISGMDETQSLRDEHEESSI